MPYLASPKARKELEKHVEEMVDKGVLRNVGENEEVTITTPLIITYDCGKSRMCGDFRALNTYTIPDRYPLPRIDHTIAEISK